MQLMIINLKYFKYILEKISNLSHNVCPAYYDRQKFWQIINKFVDDYFNIYYNDEKLGNDIDLTNFFNKKITKYLNII